MLVVIKVLVNGNDRGYLSKNRWDITENKGEAKIYEIDKPCPHTRDFSHELGHAYGITYVM